ncbi:NUDIX domain-containing protein [Sphaerisporangium sp. NPDC051011]|uniref:NUDIX domain-containing protein n=1 Tax=Sphaerisporangium sp. NPDC051011 TaxID=3155792 RepID=UPI0033DBABFB
MSGDGAGIDGVSDLPAQQGLVVELTATNFVFRRSPQAGELLAGVIWHPRFEGWLPPCGHVEAGETPAQAAQRETLEELGCQVRLLPAPGLPLPEGFPHPAGVAPWWVVSMRASPDSHTPARHMHEDHVFVSEWLADVQAPETEVAWLSEQQVGEVPGLAEDSRLQAKALFGHVRDIFAGEAAKTG